MANIVKKEIVKLVSSRWEIERNNGKFEYVDAQFCIPEQDGGLRFGDDDARFDVPGEVNNRMVITAIYTPGSWSVVHRVDRIAHNKIDKKD